MDNLTDEEKSDIRSLKRLAKKWPDSLWIFVGSGFHVMKKGADGHPVYTNAGSVNQEYIVESIDGIGYDGGDW